MTGCITHNHVDNPTMKKLSWMTKRRIAKYLLLGHRKTEVVNHILPRFRAEGQKIVGMGDVSRVSDLLKSGKHAKLRQGLDALTLLVKDDSDSCLRGVYPWPPEDAVARNVNSVSKESHLVPLEKPSPEIQTELQVSPRKNGDQVETDQAVASIVEIRSSVANADEQAVEGGGDEAFMEPVTEEAEVSPAQTVIETEQTPAHNVADDAIDEDAFQVWKKL